VTLNRGSPTIWYNWNLVLVTGHHNLLHLILRAREHDDIGHVGCLVEAVLRRAMEAPLVVVHRQVLPEEGRELVDELLRHAVVLPFHDQLRAVLAPDSVVGARVTEGDGCSPSGGGGGGGEEGEEVREAAGGGGGGRGAGRGLRLGGEGEDERRQGEERAAGAAETDEGGSHG